MSHAPNMDRNTTDRSENPSRSRRWLWRHVRLDRLFEYAFTTFLGIAILGASGKYSLAAGVLLPGFWLYQRNRRIDQLERVAKINADFWAKAESPNGADLVQTMRALHSAALPNTKDEPRP